MSCCNNPDPGLQNQDNNKKKGNKQPANKINNKPNINKPDAFIQSHMNLPNQQLQVYKKFTQLFKINFVREINQNYANFLQILNKIQNSDQSVEIQIKSIQNFSYISLQQYFKSCEGPKQIDIIQKLITPYSMACKFLKQKKQLFSSVSYLFKMLKKGIYENDSIQEKQQYKQVKRILEEQYAQIIIQYFQMFYKKIKIYNQLKSSPNSCFIEDNPHLDQRQKIQKVNQQLNNRQVNTIKQFRIKQNQSQIKYAQNEKKLINKSAFQISHNNITQQHDCLQKRQESLQINYNRQKQIVTGVEDESKNYVQNYKVIQGQKNINNLQNKQNQRNINQQQFNLLTYNIKIKELEQIIIKLKAEKDEWKKQRKDKQLIKKRNLQYQDDSKLQTMGQKVKQNQQLSNQQNSSSILQGKMIELQANHQRLVSTINQIQAEKTSLKIQLSQLQNSISILKDTIVSHQTKIFQLKKSNQEFTLKNEIKGSDKENNDLQNEFNRKILYLQESRNKLAIQNITLKKQLTAAELQCQNSIQQRNIKELQILRLNNQLQSQSLKNQTLQIELQKWHKQLDQLKEEKSIVLRDHQILTRISEGNQYLLIQSNKNAAEIKNKNDYLQIELNKLNSTIDKIKQQKSNFEIQNRYLNSKLQNLTNQNNLRIEENSNLKNHVSALQKDASELKTKSQQLQLKRQPIKPIQQQPILEMSLKIESLQFQLKQVKQLNMDLSMQLEDFRSNSRVRSKSFIQHLTLFSGDMLQHKKTQKRFIIESIERHMSKIIQKTRLIYEYKRDYKVNFHQRLDGHSNLLVVVQTKNALFAGYYSGKYAQKEQMKQQGLIISLNHYRRYALNNTLNNPKKDKKDTKPIYGMVYDKFFIIFGNSQIRIKTGQKKIFSNFGVSNAYFNSQGDNFKKLLNETTNEIELINYQIYQIFFDSELQFVN